MRKQVHPEEKQQLHCSPECRKASYEGSDKAAVRRQRYNSTAKRKTVQANYNSSDKGALRRDRWQYSKAGRAWRDIWTGKAARVKAKEEKLEVQRAGREEWKETCQRFVAAREERKREREAA